MEVKIRDLLENVERPTDYRPTNATTKDRPTNGHRELSLPIRSYLLCLFFEETYRILPGETYRILPCETYRILPGETYRIIPGETYRILPCETYRILPGEEPRVRGQGDQAQSVGQHLILVINKYI